MHRMIPATNSGLPGHPGDLPYRQQRQTGSTSSDKYILNLLFVCREIYREYCHFQYCSNVFSFSSECIFQDFMEKRTRVQKEAIWEVAVTFPTAKRYGRQLKELKKVHYGAYFPSVERATVQAQEWAGKSVEVIAWAGRFPGRPS